jgi:hypothetical protein
VPLPVIPAKRSESRNPAIAVINEAWLKEAGKCRIPGSALQAAPE